MKPEKTISVKEQRLQFTEEKESLRVMLAQISPAYDPEILKETGLVKTGDPERQAERVVKIMEYAIMEGVDLLFFPELTAPFAHRERFEDMANINILPWRSFVSGVQKRIIPNNRIGSKMFDLLFKLEERFPNYFVKHFKYPMIIMTKR